MSEVKKWERKGDCNNCGWCCQFLSVMRIVMPEKDLTPDAERFYGLRNAEKGNDGRIRLVSHQFSPCVSHDVVGKRCTVYDTRPEVCKTFPVAPDQIEGTPCTYWFEDTETGEKRGGMDSPFPSPPRFFEMKRCPDPSHLHVQVEKSQETEEGK